MKMRLLAVTAALAMCASLTACGYQGRDSEMVGQTKKIAHVTPLICPDYTSIDVSLGVMRNGSGSMSVQDEWLTAAPNLNLDTLQVAVANGSIVKFHYDVKRLAFCTDAKILTSYEILPN